jgi:hypothetical protein
MQVIRNGQVHLVRGDGILTAMQRNTIRILRKIPNAQVTLLSGITWGLWFTLLYERDIFFRISLSLQKKSSAGMEVTINRYLTKIQKKKKIM